VTVSIGDRHMTPLRLSRSHHHTRSTAQWF